MRIANADENDRGPFPSPIYTLPTKGALCVHGPVEAPTLIGTAPCFVGKQYSEDRSILEPFEVERKAETYAFPSGGMNSLMSPTPSARCMNSLMSHLRECIVDVAHTLCALPLRILHVVHRQRNIPFLQRKDGFYIHGLGVYVALGVREAGELQRGVKTRRVGTRVSRNLVGAPTLRGRGLLVRPRGASPNFHTSRAILG